MVRLKGALNGIWIPFEKVISIPYGAIKRSFDEVLKWNFDISIPYGAIKSNNVLEQIDALTKFQFLMVRLKV